MPAKSYSPLRLYLDTNALLDLWTGRNPDTDELRFNFPKKKYPGRARGYTPPRDLVEKELRALLANTAKQFPKLAGKTENILYGPAGEPYSSDYPELRKQNQTKKGG